MVGIDQVLEKLSTVIDPDLKKDIVSMGMIKDLELNDGDLKFTLELTTPACPFNVEIEDDVRKVIAELSDLKNFDLNVTAKVMDGRDLGADTQMATVKNIIGVASGKGGVGKSTVSINIAAALSKNYKVGVLDLDIYGPSLPILVNLHEQPEMTAEKKLIPLEKFNMRLMSFGFINSENAPAVWRGPMVSRMTQQFFEDVVWGELDYLILDLPPGTGDIQLTLVQKLAITGAVMVTTPQELALLDVKKGADMFGKVNTPVMGVIENMTHFLCPHCNEASRIFPGSGGADESKRLEVPLLGQIYLSPEIAQSADNGTPFVLKYEDSPITAEYMKIAQQLVELAEK